MQVQRILCSGQNFLRPLRQFKSRNKILGKNATGSKGCVQKPKRKPWCQSCLAKLGHMMLVLQNPQALMGRNPPINWHFLHTMEFPQFQSMRVWREVGTCSDRAVTLQHGCSWQWGLSTQVSGFLRAADVGSKGNLPVSQSQGVTPQNNSGVGLFSQSPRRGVHFSPVCHVTLLRVDRHHSKRFQCPLRIWQFTPRVTTKPPQNNGLAHHAMTVCFFL